MHYVIVVHGIGEQRKNSTALNVVNRFAEACRGLNKGELSGILTLGKASGQTGEQKYAPTADNNPEKATYLPWLEFKGIPQPGLKKNNQKLFDILSQSPFYGENVTQKEKGKNIRFVDLCWSDIMQDDAKHIIQPVDVWAKGLMGRLKLKNENAKKIQCKQALVPEWVIKILSNLVQALIVLQKLMGYKIKEAEHKIFTDFLGDVQLYGEFPITRGKAVRRFHRLMARIEAEHQKEQPGSPKPTYTVIAHSLGTIMSLDALLYATTKSKMRTGDEDTDVPNFPFPGYYTRKDRQPLGNSFNYLNTDWIDRVKNFVTLGSPIDKYLVMWWLNYKYLIKPSQWMRTIQHKISHYNYSDELDPVGHNVDVARTAEAFKNMFETKKDVVFNRYSVFGAAHNEYWNDSELFKAIMENTVYKEDAKQSDTEVRRFKVLKYLRLIATTYFVLPLSLSFVAALSYEWMLGKHQFQTKVIALVVLLTVFWLGSRLIKIFVLGRQVQRMKAKSSEKGGFESTFRWVIGKLIVLMLALLPIGLVMHAIYGEPWDLFSYFGSEGLYQSVSFKWFVAISYAYASWHFFKFKTLLCLTKTKIKKYEEFFDDTERPEKNAI